MAGHGTFLWCDLSTFNPDRTKPFYEALFGWSISREAYGLAHVEGRPTAGIYRMPDTFQSLGMPSFWMSYIAVDDAEAAAQAARDHGGRVEVGPAPHESGGQYALIRDPLGAGFTVFQGDGLDGAHCGAGGRLGHALFVSDASAVQPFYQALFGWDFVQAATGQWDIRAAGNLVARLYEVPDTRVRGKEQYWAVLFGGARRDPAELGAQELGQVDLAEAQARILADPDGGTFFLLDRAAPEPRRGPWLGWIGLGLIALAIVTGWGWISALFFAIWVASAWRHGETYLLEPVRRLDTPVLYWLVVATYAALAGLSLIYPAAGS